MTVLTSSMSGFLIFAAKSRHPIPPAPSLSTLSTWPRIIGKFVSYQQIVLNNTNTVGGSYRTANLLLDGVMPGPKEQDPDQTQRYMRLTVNQLLDLWENGIMVRTR